MSYRDADTRAERELAAFLDERQLYTRYLGYQSIQRVTDPELQLAGADVVATGQDRAHYIDEKAQLHYLARPLPTFAFELEFLRYGSPVTGWALRPDLMTDKYLLLWPQSNVTDFRLVGRGDFTQVGYLLLDRLQLWLRLVRLGLTPQVLRERAAQIRASGQGGRHPTGIDGITLHFSTQFDEQPINLVVRRPILEGLADCFGTLRS